MDSAKRPARGEAAGGPQGRPVEKKTFSQHLTDFLRKYRFFLLGFLGLIVVGVAAVAITSAVHSSRTQASMGRLEKLSDDMDAWSSEQDATKKAELEKTLTGGLDELVATYPRYYAAERALTMRARIAEEKKDWNSALKDWAAVAEKFPKTYLAPIALHNGAVAAEEAGNPERAAELYKALVDDYSGSVLGISHAYFALGRLTEESKDYSGALVYYEKLVASFPDDDWTKLAKDRIITIKSRGLAK